MGVLRKIAFFMFLAGTAGGALFKIMPKKKAAKFAFTKWFLKSNQRKFNRLYRKALKSIQRAKKSAKGDWRKGIIMVRKFARA